MPFRENQAGAVTVDGKGGKVMFDRPFSVEPVVICTARTDGSYARVPGVVELSGVDRSGFTFQVSNSEVVEVHWIAMPPSKSREYHLDEPAS